MPEDVVLTKASLPLKPPIMSNVVCFFRWPTVPQFSQEVYESVSAVNIFRGCNPDS